MAKSSIEWTDYTFNPWIGCCEVSPGCAHCYAKRDTFARRSRAAGRELWGGLASSDRHVTSERYWQSPERWNRDAAWAHTRNHRTPRPRVFCGSLCDVFEDRRELREPRARLWEIMAATPYLDWCLLTKRPENAQRLAERACKSAATRHHWRHHWGDNVLVGTSVENQTLANLRLPPLVALRARRLFVSVEPMLGPVDLAIWLYTGVIGAVVGDVDYGALSWVICGGESGPGARPFDIAWARELRDQCKSAGTSFFMKQIGSRPYDSWEYEPRLPKTPLATRRDKGNDPRAWPPTLRIRQQPPEVPHHG